METKTVWDVAEAEGGIKKILLFNFDSKSNQKYTNYEIIMIASAEEVSRYKWMRKIANLRVPSNIKFHIEINIINKNFVWIFNIQEVILTLK